MCRANAMSGRSNLSRSLLPQLSGRFSDAFETKNQFANHWAQDLQVLVHTAPAALARAVSLKNLQNYNLGKSDAMSVTIVQSIDCGMNRHNWVKNFSHPLRDRS